MIEARVYFTKALRESRQKTEGRKVVITVDQPYVRRGGKRLLLRCLFHPLPNNPRALNFQLAEFFHRLEAPQSILHRPGLLAVLLLRMQMLHLEKAGILSPA